MRRTHVALIPIVVSLALAGCSVSDQGTTSPRGIAPTEISSADVIPTCSASLFSTMQRDAGAYFPSGDPVFGLISDMKTAFRTSLAAATPIGFNILTDLAAVRDAGSQIGTAAAGGKFADEVVGCMDLGTIPSKFLAASALGTGVFEVRGGNPTALAATAFNSTPGSTQAASPLWGAEANGTWARSTSIAPYGLYLIYGYANGADVRTAGFELGTLPAIVSTSFPTPDVAFRVGLCIAQSQGNTANRLVHSNAIVTDLTNVTFQGAQFCQGNVIASAGTSTWLASLLHGAANLFAPRRLSAQDGGFFGIGGLPDGWSPFNPNALAGSSINLIYVQQPTNENVNTNIVPTVTVQAADGSLLIPGVAITISITNNSGSPDIITGNTATTDKNGIATFPGLQLNKAGGYTLTASGSISGVATNSVISNLFNVKNQ